MDQTVAKVHALHCAGLSADQFRPDFHGYLEENWHVYAEFERRALLVGERRKHYSARTIAETIRHDTVIGELHTGFKVNNNMVPDMARLFAMLHPGHAGLFEYRDHKAAA
jgi:hypothetical protein